MQKGTRGHDARGGRQISDPRGEEARLGRGTRNFLDRTGLGGIGIGRLGGGQARNQQGQRKKKE